MAESRKYKQMLLKIGRLIRSDELMKLKFACKNEIPTRQREKIDSSEALFEALEEKGRLSENNLTYLKGVLHDALNGRTDVLKVVEEYEQEATASPDVDADRFTGQQSLVFRQESQYLEDNLGREYKSFFRRLGVEDHHLERIEHNNPRNVKEVIHQCLYIWLQANNHVQHAELLKTVISALRKEKRNDLANSLAAGTF